MPDDMRNNMKVYEIEKEARERRLLAYADAIQRRTLGESSQIIKELVEERHRLGMTQQDISKALGKSQSALSNKVRLLKLPVDVRYFIEKEGLTERHARALLNIENEKDIWTVLNVIKDRHLNVAQTESYIATFYAKPKKQKRPHKNLFRKKRMESPNNRRKGWEKVRRNEYWQRY